MKQEPQIILCPYCGHVQTVPENAAVPDQCDECKGLFEPLSRRATQISMGPWYIRDKKNPFRPGCSYEVISKMARNNRIRPTTVMRGPSTKQFWSVARNVPGVAHLLGYCHSCSAKVEPTATACTACNAKFEEPKERNELGLAYRTGQEAAAAQRALEKEIAAITGAPTNSSASGIAPAISAAPGAGLLDEVLGGKNGGSPLLNFSSGFGSTATTPAPTQPARPAAAAPATAAAPSGQPNFAAGFAAAPDAGRAVDAFSLGGEADDTGIDGVQRKQQKLSTMTKALVGFNILLVVVVVVLMLMNKGKPANARNNDDNTPEYVDNTPSKTNSTNSKSQVTPPPVAPRPVRKTDAFGNLLEPDPVTPKSNVPSIPIDPTLDRDAMNAKVEQAAELVSAGDYEKALPLMQSIRDMYPSAWLPDNFTAQMATVKKELDRRAQEVIDKRLAEEVADLLAKAKVTQAKNDYIGTVTLLAQVRDNYPAKFHPKDLSVQIAASLKHVDRKAKDGGKFFGQSTD